MLLDISLPQPLTSQSKINYKEHLSKELTLIPKNFNFSLEIYYVVVLPELPVYLLFIHLILLELDLLLILEKNLLKDNLPV